MARRRGTEKAVQGFRDDMQRLVDDPQSGIKGISVTFQGRTAQLAKRKELSMAGESDVESAVIPVAHVNGLKMTPKKNDAPATATLSFTFIVNDEWDKCSPLIEHLLRTDQPTSLVLTEAQVRLPNA